MLVSASILLKVGNLDFVAPQASPTAAIGRGWGNLYAVSMRADY